MKLLRTFPAMLLILGVTAQAEDWPRFRGPNGSGITEGTMLPPETWSPSENLQWKSQLPGAGVSSPIVVDDRVFVTCYSGYGLDRESPGEMDQLKRHLVCMDAHSGETIWQKSIDAVLPEDPYTGIGVTAHGYASHTPTSDGERVYVFFGKTGVLAFDMDGALIWKTSVGTDSDRRGWGSSSSPILYKDTVIVTASAESLAIVALDKNTGKEVWRSEAGGLEGTWGSPILLTNGDGVTELVMSVPYEVWGMNPETGKLLWYCESGDADQANASAVVDGSFVYAMTGRGGGSISVRGGGKDDVTDSNVAWTGNDSARFASPLVHQGRIYLIGNGIVSVIDAKTGEKLSQARIDGGKSAPAPANRESGRESVERGSNDRGFGGRGGRGGFGGRGGGFGGSSQDYASPVLAGDKLYHLSGSGEVFVFQIGESLKQLHVNRLTDEKESFGGTPAISNGRLFIRSDKHLYCIAE